MTQHGPCDCSHIEDENESEKHACCGGEHCHNSEEGNEDGCSCGHDHGHCHELSEEDMKKLEDAISEAGYTMEKSPNGDIRIVEK